MECTINWIGNLETTSNMGMLAETGSGHIIAMDSAINASQLETSGRNTAPRPLELLLAGTGGCTTYDIVLILKRGRHAIKGCTVKLTAERAETEPKVFTKIHMHYTITGSNIPDSSVKRAIDLSHEKFCSASAMLAKTAEITSDFEILQG